MTRPTVVRLSHNAMIAVLDYLGARKIVGANFREFDLPAQELEVIISHGRNELENDGLIRDSKSDDLFLEPRLEDIVRTLVNRQAAILIVIKSKGRGQFSLSFNIRDNLIVEHFIEETGDHVLTGFLDYAIFSNRIAEIIPLKTVSDLNRPQLDVTTSFLENLIDLAKRSGGDKKIAYELRSKNYSEEVTESLVNTLSKPLLSVSGAFLMIEDDEAVEASSFSIFADENASWGIWPKAEKDKVEYLWLMPSGINDILNCLKDWLAV